MDRSTTCHRWRTAYLLFVVVVFVVFLFAGFVLLAVFAVAGFA